MTAFRLTEHSKQQDFGISSFTEILEAQHLMRKEVLEMESAASLVECCLNLLTCFNSTRVEIFVYKRKSGNTALFVLKAEGREDLLLHESNPQAAETLEKVLFDIGVESVAKLITKVNSHSITLIANG